MKKIWIRLGGFISANEADEKKILAGDTDALVEAINKNGFAPNGETYIPGEDDDVDFDINPGALFLRSDRKTVKGTRNLTISALERYLKASGEMSRRCEKQFIRMAKAYIKKHPELKDKKIWFDPDATINGELDTKHGGSWVGNIIAVGFDKKGHITFDISTEYDLQKDVPSVFESGYGVYLEDWVYALKVLLRHFEEPYDPEEDEE